VSAMHHENQKRELVQNHVNKTKLWSASDQGKILNASK
jgi:hypothetical protein